MHIAMSMVSTGPSFSMSHRVLIFQMFAIMQSYPIVWQLTVVTYVPAVPKPFSMLPLSGCSCGTLGRSYEMPRVTGEGSSQAIIVTRSCAHAIHCMFASLRAWVYLVFDACCTVMVHSMSPLHSCHPFLQVHRFGTPSRVASKMAAESMSIQEQFSATVEEVVGKSPSLYLQKELAEQQCQQAALPAKVQPV